MAFDYGQLDQLCLDQISEFGGMATLRQTDCEYDPIAGEMTGQINEFSFKAVMTKPDEAAIAEGLVSSSDGLLLVAANSIEQQPKAGETIIWNDEEWRIAAISLVAPNGKPLLYKLLVKRA